jgi:RNA polymerase subunit RPABC4/transcription elongation factor Spt4
MPDYPQRISTSFSERMRLIRFRRKHEKSTFWQEFKIIPRWVIGVVIFLFLVAQVVAFLVNRFNAANGDMFPPELAHDPPLAALALAGIITGISLFLGALIFLVAYVNRDAKRRGMSYGLWTLVVVVGIPAYLALGFLLYFFIREPLPFPCPVCQTTVGARYNFCPNCRTNLFPSCPQCKREVVESDKFCPHCGNDLAAAKKEGLVVAESPEPGLSS